LRPDVVVAFVVGAALAAAVVVAGGYLVRSEHRRGRSAVSELREEWLDPFAEHLLTLTEEERENAHQVDQVHTALTDVQQKVDELNRRFLAVRTEIRRLQDDAIATRYRLQLGLPDASMLKGLVYAGDPVSADRILTKYLRAVRALDLSTTLLTAADGGRHVRLWLRRRSAGDSSYDLDRRVEEALSEVLTWCEDAADHRHTASPPARALADAIAQLGGEGDAFVQLGRAVFVSADAKLAVAVLTDEDLAYLEEHPDLTASPPQALARMRARMRGRYLDLTPTLHALTGGPGGNGAEQ
jgi:outer membrane murein-binding lipoprotein Lpp